MLHTFKKSDLIDLVALEREAFLEAYPAWANNPDVTRLMFTGTFPETAEQAAKVYDAEISSASNVVMGVVDPAQGHLIGTVGLYSIDWIGRKAEFRILLGDPTSWGKGFGTEATAMILTYAFERLNLNKVWLGVNIANTAAVKCYEKVGFVHEGLLRQEAYCAGSYYDVARMSILRSEFNAVDG